MSNMKKEHQLTPKQQKIVNGLITALVCIAIIAIAGCIIWGISNHEKKELAVVVSQNNVKQAARESSEAAMKAESERIASSEAAIKAESDLAASSQAAMKAESDRLIKEEEQRKADEKAVADAKAKAESDAKAAPKDPVDVNKPLAPEKPASSAPAPKPESKPEPVPALNEEDRTPATTQQNQVIDTTLSKDGIHHGDSKLNSVGQTVYFHVGVDMYISETKWLQGRWASHPEGTRELYDRWNNIGYAFSPFQEHGDIIMDGEEFYFCSYCCEITNSSDANGNKLSYEEHYRDHARDMTNKKHQEGVVQNIRYPIK